MTETANIPAVGQAVVVKHTGSHYLLSRLPEWNLFPAVLRGKVRLKGSTATNPVAVGDIVDYEYAEGMSAIAAIHPRKNYIIRRSANLSREAHIIAANVDQAYLIVTMAFPETKLAFVDRFLTTCEAYGVPVSIIMNKCDLHDDALKQTAESFCDIYAGAGYGIIEVSAVTGENVDALRERLAGKVSLFSGTSGVGKSSLIKAIDPSLEMIRTAEISSAHLQGRHTTTFYEMYPIASGGFVIDSPGIRGFGLVDFKKEELSTYFPEMLRVMDNCRFKPCTHTHEPGCAVKAAVDSGQISPDRYYSYLGMLEEENKYR
ncbi:MAG: ribosome small subunit-dependent GTPase A [Bacteroidales bacterium]|nr:ribosome small subunit-dependent GTPase A [Bacteroidales bacterium]